MKNILIAAVAVLLLIIGIYYFINRDDAGTTEYNKAATTTPEVPPTTATPTSTAATPTESESPDDAPRGDESTLGTSAGGSAITAYHFGTGEKEVTFIGGIHGGYSWNTALLAYEVIDWLRENPDAVPKELTVTVIPVLNPDGLKAITGTTGRFTKEDVKGTEADRIAGRFNSNEVDLNRNFDCKWQAAGTWQNRSVSGGSSAFSEPEAVAIREYTMRYEPEAVVVWYSAAGGVYASNCEKGVLAETEVMTNLFAKAASYTAHEEFDYYEITGDMVNWFARQNIPAISVLLSTHEATEFTKNKAGIIALLSHLSK